MSQPSPPPSPTGRGRLTDSHVHLWDPTRFRMPWLDGEPTLNKPFGVAEFAVASAGLDVESIVYVQVDAMPAYGLLEARWAAAQPRVGAVVAFAPMEDGDVVRTYLDELVKIGPRIKGVRRLIQSETDPAFIPTLNRGLQILPGYGLSFDICIRHHQLADTVRLVRGCPETDFILDHVAKPDIRSGLLDPWRQHMAELASMPNVVCKISGMVTEADHANWTMGDLEPYVAHALAVFGEDRVLFGGDWPVATLASSYKRWVESLERLTQHLSPEAKEKLWRTNAKRIYRISD